MKSVGLRSALVRPFQTHGRLDRGVLLAFLAINAIVLVNAVVHHPAVGYDASKHLVHVDVLSELRLATRKDTDAFYYPPLPYVLPAAFKLVTGASLHAAAKFAQGVNVLLSLGLTFFLLSACRLIRPSSTLRLATLLALGVVPAYYRTFAFVRGEPYVAFFGTLAMYFVVRVYVRGRLTTGGALGLGLSLGLAALSRQWGLFLIPAAAIFGLVHLVLHKRWRGAVVRAMLLSLVVATVVGTSFLLLQRARFGSATKFNRRPAPCFSLLNQPDDFYFGGGDGRLFERPVRPYFPNQLVPIYYSELWGDYWGHFLIYAVDTRTQDFVPVRFVPWRLREGPLPEWLVSNYESMDSELGRLNFVSLLPTAIVLAAMVAAGVGLVAMRTPRRRRAVIAYVLPGVVFSLCGYLWFLIMYPNPGRGDTIKASYMLHTFPYVALLTGLFVDRVRTSLPLVGRFLILLLVLSALHNSTAMVSRCTNATLQTASSD